jgi:hypothetical protein
MGDPAGWGEDPAGAGVYQPSRWNRKSVLGGAEIALRWNRRSLASSWNCFLIWRAYPIWCPEAQVPGDCRVVPAEDGRRRRPPAGPALKVEEKLLKELRSFR